MSIWADAWASAAKLARRMADVGYSASKVRDLPHQRVVDMRKFFGYMKRADPDAFTEVVCEYAQHAANGVAEVMELQAEVEEARAGRPLEDDEPTPVVPTRTEEP